MNTDKTLIRWLAFGVFAVSMSFVALILWGRMQEFNGPSFLAGLVGALGLFGWAVFLDSFNKKESKDGNKTGTT